jgi:hypothetical protein
MRLKLMPPHARRGATMSETKGGQEFDERRIPKGFIRYLGSIPHGAAV